MRRLALKVTRQTDFCRQQKKNIFWMMGILLLTLVFCQKFSEKALSSEKAHPAVVCVIAWEPESPSRGSGSLIGKKAAYGYIITNWHVVRDSTGMVMIRYADGQAAKGVVISVDSLWDLALIATTAPNAEPIRIASKPPEKGDPLWLAGYGADNVYKMAGGYCTQYASPSVSRNAEKELLEFSAAARMGDSGGPIFNRNQELAGVLFGTNSKVTLGSYCGRVLKFIDQSAPYVLALPNDPEELFQLALNERRTILQRNTVTKPPVINPTQPVAEKTESRTVENYSSSSSFGGGGSKKRRNNIQPLADPFVSVESIQPHFGFQGFDYKKESQTASSGQTSNRSVALSGISATNQTGTAQISPSATQNYQNQHSGVSPASGYSVSKPVQYPASNASRAATQSLTPARELPGSVAGSLPPSSITPLPPASVPAATSLPYSSASPATSSSSMNAGVHTGNGYGQTGTTARSSYGQGQGYASTTVQGQSTAPSLPATPSPYNSLPAASSGSLPPSSTYSGHTTPARTLTTPQENRSISPEKANNPSSGYGNDSQQTPDYFNNSYSRSSSFPQQETYSPYASIHDQETELMEGEILEKYASPTSISMQDPSSSKTMVTPRNAVKIIGAVIVIFFVLFHAVKLMSIIEEP